MRFRSCRIPYNIQDTSAAHRRQCGEHSDGTCHPDPQVGGILVNYNITLYCHHRYYAFWTNIRAAVTELSIGVQRVPDVNIDTRKKYILWTLNNMHQYILKTYFTAQLTTNQRIFSQHVCNIYRVIHQTFI